MAGKINGVASKICFTNGEFGSAKAESSEPDEEKIYCLYSAIRIANALFPLPPRGKFGICGRGGEM
jgi:hypothetical protein